MQAIVNFYVSTIDYCCYFRIQDNKPTCPSKWGEEKLYNPFLRFNESSVREFAGVTEPVDVLEKIREAKNNFKP